MLPELKIETQSDLLNELQGILREWGKATLMHEDFFFFLFKFQVSESTLESYCPVLWEWMCLISF